MKNPSALLSNGTFVRTKYRKLLIAGILTWLVTMVDTYADTFIAGIYINEAAVSGVELVTPFFSILTFVAYLIATGTALLYSRESGAFRYECAYGLVGQGIICAAAASVFLVIAMAVLREPLMNYYSPSPEVVTYANEYYTYQTLFALMYPIFYVVAQLVVIDGDEAVPVAATITMAGVNLGTSLLLVGNYGVRGMALGTAVGALCGLCVYCLHFLRKTNSIRLRFRFAWKDVAEMLKLSSTAAVTMLYVAIIDIIMNKYVISNFTDAYLPAYAVINFVLNLGTVFSSSFDAASGFVSVAYGERNPVNIKKVMKIATAAVLVEAVLAFVVIECAAAKIPQYYGITNPDVYAAAMYAARLVAVSFPAIGLYYLYRAYYSAVGHVVLGNIATAVYMLITPLAVAIPLGNTFGFNGLSLGFMLTSVIAVVAVILIICFRYGRKAVPLIPEKTEEKALSYDLCLHRESIAALCDAVRSNLTEQGIAPGVVNEVQLVLEESYLTILEKNAGRKVLSECNLLISNQALRLITRDNGMIFDMTDADAKIKSLRSYVLAGLMERNPGRSHVTTISFNRNSYLWQW